MNVHFAAAMNAAKSKKNANARKGLYKVKSKEDND